MKAYSEAVKGDVLEMKSVFCNRGFNIPEKRPVLLPAQVRLAILSSRFQTPMEIVNRLMVLTARCGIAEATDQTIIPGTTIPYHVVAFSPFHPRADMNHDTGVFAKT